MKEHDFYVPFSEDQLAGLSGINRRRLFKNMYHAYHLAQLGEWGVLQTITDRDLDRSRAAITGPLGVRRRHLLYMIYVKSLLLTKPK